ncbi:hypothetical protein EZV62_000143 [Acer yangbiense]|uniref:Uncharacterized protein n=1 Tax=Acer yangbiense TaxID=1000413 RepID=A0A5C7IRW9_9ROSI|nr:hypothetical protein EZV62_000143 [Acer yangbiense]
MEAWMLGIYTQGVSVEEELLVAHLGLIQIQEGDSGAAQRVRGQVGMMQDQELFQDCEPIGTSSTYVSTDGVDEEVSSAGKKRKQNGDSGRRKSLQRKKNKGVRFDRLAANGKLHVDFKGVKPIGPIGPNAKKFASEVRIVFMRHAPLNVGKWDDITDEQIQPLIDRVLSKFDVDISRPYVKGRMLWKMKLEHKNARREAQDAKITELMSKFASSNIGSFDMDQTPKIAKKKKGVRSNVKLHVVFDSSVGEPRGCNCYNFFKAIGTIVSRHAPLNVGKWDDIPEKKIQSLINRVLRMFDVDISKPYVQDWILWRMKFRFCCIMEDKAKKEAQNAEVMELMSKLDIGSFDMDLEVDSKC